MWNVGGRGVYRGGWMWRDDSMVYYYVIVFKGSRGVVVWALCVAFLVT